MNHQLCEAVMEIEREIRMLEDEQKRLQKENDKTWEQLVYMAKGYLDRVWEIKLNNQGRFYSQEEKTFVDVNSHEDDLTWSKN